MTYASKTFAAAAAALTFAMLPAAASAQSAWTDDVRFFERVNVGEVEVTPYGIVRDTRCADVRFCEREDTLIVTLILHTYRGQREVILRMGEPAVVPGGYLVLRDAGTRPSLRGAIALDQYRLDLEFISFADENLR